MVHIRSAGAVTILLKIVPEAELFEVVRRAAECGISKTQEHS